MIAAALSAAAVHAGCGDDSAVSPVTPAAQSEAGGAGGLVGGAAGAGGEAGGGGEAGWAPRFDAFAAALQADLSDADALGVSAAVMEAGEVTFAAAYGSKDHDGQPLTPSTLMQIGSVTKQLTSVGLLRKVEAGLVSFDDTLEQTLPSLELALDPTWDDQITVHHLLTHQGAFIDGWSAFQSGAENDDYLASFAYGPFAANWFLMAPPGSFWNYANPNFGLAGLVTEHLDTRPWPDIMRDDVFVPLGMDRTYVRKADVEADGDYALSFGYDESWDGPRNVVMDRVGDDAFIRPPGLAWSTPTEMMAWATFLMHGQPAVLRDDLRQAITHEQVDTLNIAGNLHYGFGVFVARGYLSSDDAYHEMPMWLHDGVTQSFTTLMVILPEHDFALCIISSGWKASFMNSFEVALETLIDLPPPSQTYDNEPDPSTFESHVGEYYDAYSLGEVSITREDATLHVSIPTLEDLGIVVEPVLEPVSRNSVKVVIDGDPYYLTLISDEPGGDTTYLRNRYFVAARVPASFQGPTDLAGSADRATRWLMRRRGPQPRSPLAHMLPR